MTTRDCTEVPTFSAVPAQQIFKPIHLEALTETLAGILTHTGRELAQRKGHGLIEQAQQIQHYKGQLEALTRLADVAIYRVRKVEQI